MNVAKMRRPQLPNLNFSATQAKGRDDATENHQKV